MFSLNIQFSFWIEVVYGRSLLAALREANIAPHRGKEGWGMSAGRLQVPPDHAYGIKCIGSDTTVLAGFPVCKLPQTSPNVFKNCPALN